MGFADMEVGGYVQEAKDCGLWTSSSSLKSYILDVVHDLALMGSDKPCPHPVLADKYAYEARERKAMLKEIAVMQKRVVKLTTKGA